MYNSESYILRAFYEDRKGNKLRKRERAENWRDRLNWVNLFVIWIVLAIELNPWPSDPVVTSEIC